MDVSALASAVEASKADGELPFMVIATAGTTVLGAFDKIKEIASVCRKHGMWLHVDAAWGGGALLSPHLRPLLEGIEYSDSVTWNPHKLMGTTLQCALLLVKQKGVLEACHGTGASYLFQPDKNYDIRFDTGDKVLQCGRRNDVFKLWLQWRSKGDCGYERQMDSIFDLAKKTLKEIQNRGPRFRLVIANPQMVNISFWYIPPSLRKTIENEEGSLKDGHREEVLKMGPLSQQTKESLHRVAPKIKAKLMESGGTMVGFQPLDEKPNFFRLIISNPASTFDDVKFLLDSIERFGEDL